MTGFSVPENWMTIPDREMKPTLIFTRGLPGSGKTFRATMWVAQKPRLRARVNRDCLRLMLHNLRFSGMQECEEAVTAAHDAAIRALLEAGYDVVSDNTYLRDDHVDRICNLASSVGAHVEVWDLRDVSLEVCISRDAKREHPVGAETIRKMWEKHINRNEGPASEESGGSSMGSYVDEAREALREKLLWLDPTLENLYLLLVLASGSETTRSQVHDAWAIWTSHVAPERPNENLVPYEDLSPEVQALDQHFLEAIKHAASRIGR